MEAKLIKFPDGDWVVEIPEDKKGIKGSMMQGHFGSTFGHGHKLSFKNCQAIERGYDLDEHIAFEIQAYIAEKHNQDECTGFMDGYEIGFQKALDLMDKKFSEEDVKKAITDFYLNEKLLTEKNLNDSIQSLQQKEWDVEIEMDIIYGIFDYKKLRDKPKLDADGCLILKRV